MKIVRSEEMREMDSDAIKTYGIPEIILMENAAEAASRLILEKMTIIDKTILIFAGPGNNGGDALALSRLLYAKGALPIVSFFSETGSPLYQQQLTIIKKMPIELIPFFLFKEETAAEADLIVDGIFGTGLTREIEGDFKAAIKMINSAEKTIVSLDIASGIQGNSGQIMGCAVNADFTIGFGLPKRGNLLYPGFSQGGELFITPLSFPPELFEKQNDELQLLLPPPIPQRTETGHKGSFGKVLIIGGSAQYGGAPVLAASACLKSGSGYVYLAVPGSLINRLQAMIPEAVFIPLPETEEQTISEEALHQLLDLSGVCTSVLIGPGMGRNDETDSLICQFTEECPAPLIIDGDGISAFSKDITPLQVREKETILTPHAAEASRLIDFSIPEINNRRIEAVQELSRLCHSYTVLKGAHSLVSTPEEKVFLNLSGNSGMATAGSGDVLGGMIAGFISNGKSMIDALNLAVFMHGMAGDIGSAELSEESITAGDIARSIPDAIRYYKSNHSDIIKNFYGKIKQI